MIENMKQNKVDQALECFNSGFNCSQAVLSAFCEDYGLDKKTALKISTSFGAGMGYVGETCGAVTGAFMAIGLKYGKYDIEDKSSKEKTYLLVQEFTSRFKELNGSISCKGLLEYDLSDEKQLDDARNSGVFTTKCPKYVSDAVQILEEIIIK